MHENRYACSNCKISVNIFKKCNGWGGTMATKETKREKFVRLAEARTNKILDMLKLLGNCSSKSNYEYSDDDVKKIFAAIERETKDAKAKFNGKDIQKENRFRLE